MSEDESTARIAQGGVETWLDGLDWASPQEATQRIGRLLSDLRAGAESRGDAEAAALYHRILDRLDDAQQPEAGTLAGFYRDVHRPVPGEMAASVPLLNTARLWMREPTGGSSRFTHGARVSVVVTCFNLGEYLYEALASIARQTLPELDLLIVDDGSTDPYTLAYLEFLIERGYAVLQQGNAGLAEARNAGIRAVAGEYLCCFDADDRMHPDWLARAAKVLDSDPALGYVSCYYRTFDNEQAVYRYDHPRLPEMLVENQTVGVSVFRRQAWKKVNGYCSEFRGMEDWDFWVGILASGYGAAVIPEVLFYYRVRIGSMYSTVRESGTYMANMALLLSRHRRAFEEHWPSVVLLRTRRFAELLEARRGEAAGFQLQLWQAAEQHRSEIAGIEAQALQLRSEIARLETQALQLRSEIAGVEAQALQLRSEIARLEAQAVADGIRLDELGVWSAKLTQVLASQAPGLPGRAIRNLLLLLSAPAGSRHWKNLSLWLRLAREPRRRAAWDRMFDAPAYLANHPDILASGVSPSLHYVLRGYREGRIAAPTFDTGAYLQARPDVAAAGVNPLLHYVVSGNESPNL